MRRSRAGRTGRSRYGSYELWYEDGAGVVRHHDVTNRQHGERWVRQYVRDGAVWAELRGDSTSEQMRGVVFLRVIRSEPRV